MALILGWVLSSYREKRPLIYGLKVNRPILALVIATLASWFIGIMHPGGFSHGLGRFVEVYQWLGVMALFYITISTVRCEKQVKYLLAIMGLVTTVMAIDLIRTHHLLLVTGYSHNLGMGGVFGVGGENDLGAFLAEFSLVILTLIGVSRRFAGKLFYAALLLISGLGLLYTYSRGAYLGAVAGLLFYAYSKDRRLMIVVAVVLLTFPVWAPASVMDRISMTFADGAMESSAASRIDFWKAGLQMMLQSPILVSDFIALQKNYPTT
ncbi:MAG: O-antigen ligase family protein [Candidatus Marinimicrobia bacterium]|nr:O-antigen ligase family protein [Candidatus Neomarinimicrobiota bacterium]